MGVITFPAFRNASASAKNVNLIADLHAGSRDIIFAKVNLVTIREYRLNLEGLAWRIQNKIKNEIVRARRICPGQRIMRFP